MEDDASVVKSSPKNFFQTLPGIITGIAAIITALGGFILALNQTGCFGTRNIEKVAASQVSTSKLDRSSSTPDNLSGVTDKPATDNTMANGSPNSEVTWSKDPINFLSQQVILSLKDVTIQSLPNNEVFLQLTIKCINESNSIFNWGPTGLRVKAGEDKYSPDDSSPSSMASVYPHSFKLFTFNYKLSTTVKDYTILFYDLYEGKEIGTAAVRLL